MFVYVGTPATVHVEVRGQLAGVILLLYSTDPKVNTVLGKHLYPPSILTALRTVSVWMIAPMSLVFKETHLQLGHSHSQSASSFPILPTEQAVTFPVALNCLLVAL